MTQKPTLSHTFSHTFVADTAPTTMAPVAGARACSFAQASATNGAPALARRDAT